MQTWTPSPFLPREEDSGAGGLERQGCGRSQEHDRRTDRSFEEALLRHRRRGTYALCEADGGAQGMMEFTIEKGLWDEKV